MERLSGDPAHFLRARLGQRHVQSAVHVSEGRKTRQAARGHWVTPTCANSDHAGCYSDTGPSWVASVVNAIGESKYWGSTAIFIFWDDYGGWYDPAPPAYVDYDGLGFRLPMLVISPYAKKGYVSHVHYEHGSILKFIEDQLGLERLSASDRRANSPARDCFDFNEPLRKFKKIVAPYDAEFFLHQPPDLSHPGRRLALAELAARTWGTLSRTTGGLRRVEAAQRAAALAEQANDAADTALSFNDMAFGFVQAGRAGEAQAAIERAIQLVQQNALTGSSIHACVLNNAALVANDFGRLNEARQLYHEALTLSTSHGDTAAATGIRLNMAELEFDTGHLDTALELTRAVEAEPRTPRMKRHVFFALQNGAAYRLALGDFAGARAAALDALQLIRGTEPHYVTINIAHLATVAACSGDPRRGARLRGYVDAQYRSEGYVREPTEQRIDELLASALSEKLSLGEIEAFAAEGTQLSEDQAVAEALAA